MSDWRVGGMFESDFAIIDDKRLHADYVTATVPGAKSWMFDGRPARMLLDVGEFVWVSASYADEMPDGVVQVGDGRSTGYDTNGDRILSIPVGWCKFHSEEDAENIMRAIAADERLLSYAR